jgi:hypothetical protein
VASGAVAAEAGNTDGMNFILDFFRCPFSLTAAHPLKSCSALFGVIKGGAFWTSNSRIFQRSCAPEKEKRDKVQYQKKAHPFFHRT